MKTQLPALIDGEEVMVDVAVHWINLVAKILTSEAGHRRLQNDIRERLRSGTIETVKVIAAAEAGHQDADLALRESGAEMLDGGEMPNAALRGYLVKALLIAPVTYPAGRNIADTWTRDIGIAVLVGLVIMHWPYLKATRNRASKRPSASTIVSRALYKRGHMIGEWQVERIFRDHHKLAERLSASIPLH